MGVVGVSFSPCHHGFSKRLLLGSGGQGQDFSQDHPRFWKIGSSIPTQSPILRNTEDQKRIKVHEARNPFFLSLSKHREIC